MPNSLYDPTRGADESDSILICRLTEASTEFTVEIPVWSAGRVKVLATGGSQSCVDPRSANPGARKLKRRDWSPASAHIEQSK